VSRTAVSRPSFRYTTGINTNTWMIIKSVRSQKVSGV
jgi:hypothetical protein